jgi:hypothetical protein
MLRVADRRKIDVGQMVFLDDQIDVCSTSGLPALAYFQFSYQRWIPVDRAIYSATADVRLLVMGEIQSSKSTTCQ